MGCLFCRDSTGNRKAIDASPALHDVKDSFDIFDRNRDGVITMDEIMEAFKEMQLPISSDDAEDLIIEFDTDNDGVLDFDEFILFMKKYLRAGDTCTLSMFEYFDQDGDGFIQPSEFSQAMKCLGLIVSEKEADSIMSPYYKSSQKKIDYADFNHIMHRYI